MNIHQKQEIFFDFDANSFSDNSKEQIKQVEICENSLFYRSDVLQTVAEINDDLIMIDPLNSFWTTIEYETKIDIEPCDIRDVLINTVRHLGDKYTVSKISHQKTYEKHYKIQKPPTTIHCVKLGKKNWRIKKAIKTKTEYNSLGRYVTIQPYTEECWSTFIQDAVKITEYPAFYKNKYRYIIVNKQKGSVFGVSSSATCFIAKKYPNKFEIEIEYWSNLLPEGSHHRFDDDNKEELYEIVKLIESQLSNNGVNWVFPGVRKSEWVEGIYNQE